MSVLNVAAGDGRLQYDTTGNLKPALVNGESWYAGAWVRIPVSLSGGNYAAVGIDNGNDGGTPTQIGEAGINIGSSSLRRMQFFARASVAAQEAWSSASTQDFIGQTQFAPGDDLLVLWGVFDASGAGDWRLWRAVVAKGGTILGREVTPAGNANVQLFATNPHRGIGRIFNDRGSAANQSRQGTAIEHVVSVLGRFPMVDGLPSADVLTKLANGTYTYASPEVLGSGTINDWRRLYTIADLSDLSAAKNPVLTRPANAAGNPNAVTTASAIAPWPAPQLLSMVEPADGHAFEGTLAKGAVPLTGIRPEGETVQVRVMGAVGGVVLDWGSSDIAITYPTPTTWRAVVSLERSRYDFFHEVRLTSDPNVKVSCGTRWGVGTVLVVNGQSWFQRLSNAGGAGANGMPTSVTPNNVRLGQTVSTARDSAGAALYRVDRLNAPGRTGSGYTTMADQLGRMFGADGYPVLIHDCTYSGKPLDDWLNDTGSWPLMTGFLRWSLARCDGRITAILREVMFDSRKYGNRSAGLDELMKFVDGELVNQPAGKPCQIWVSPSWRSASQASAFVGAREELSAKVAANPDRYRLLGQSPDIQTDCDGGNHAACGQGANEQPIPKDDSVEAHRAGQIRFGRKLGASIGAQLQAIDGLPVLDVFGPRTVSARFTSAAHTHFDVTFDRDLHVPAGSAAVLPQQWVSTDRFGSNQTECMGVLVGPRTVRVAHPTGGNWQGVAELRYGYLRGDLPWYTGDGGANGGERAIRAKLDTLIYDTADYEDGRGFVATPATGSGLRVLEAGAAPEPVALDLEVTVDGGSTIARTLTIRPA